VVGMAAQRAGTAFVLFIDELQYVEEDQYFPKTFFRAN
jgi:hypothetical protein